MIQWRQEGESDGINAVQEVWAVVQAVEEEQEDREGDRAEGLLLRLLPPGQGWGEVGQRQGPG